MNLRTSARRLTTAALAASRLLDRLVDQRLRGKLLVLMYHRVLPRSEQRDSFSADAIVVSPESFDRQMALLRREFTPLTPERLEGIRAGDEPLPPRACLVTFDDGWYDNERHALPILQRHGIPAVVFVATDYIDTDRCFWQERLARLLYAAWETGDRSVVPAGVVDPVDVRRRIRSHIDALKAEDREEIRATLELEEAKLTARGATLPNGADRFMTWADVKKLAASGLVSIGSHACSHTPLTRLTVEEARRELDASRRILEKHLGRPPSLLAYPNGDYDAERVALARAAGYRLAFTTASRHATAADDALTLPRINIAEAGTSANDQFLARIAGLL